MPCGPFASPLSEQRGARKERRRQILEETTESRRDMANIPYGRQHIDEADIQAVADVLRSDFLTQGPAVPAFEKSIADYCAAAHAVL